MLRRLLIVDGDPAALRTNAAAFPGGEFLVRQEEESRAALDCVLQWRPECLVLDAVLTGGSGLELCRRVKSSRQTDRIPILMTSTTREQVLVNRGLSEGADDFLSKPCHPTELLWRVRGLLRRYQDPAPAPKALRLGPLELDPAQGLAKLAGREVELTRKELLLLEVFLRNPGRVMTRRFLLEAIWGYDSSVRTRVVDLCVFQLRRKLGTRWGGTLNTRRGFGYCLNFAPASK